MINFSKCLYTLLDQSFELSMTVKVILMVTLMLSCAAIAYLCGSVNSAVIISKLLYHDDIRKTARWRQGLRCSET